MKFKLRVLQQALLIIKQEAQNERIDALEQLILELQKAIETK